MAVPVVEKLTFKKHHHVVSKALSTSIYGLALVRAMAGVCTGPDGTRFAIQDHYQLGRLAEHLIERCLAVRAGKLLLLLLVQEQLQTSFEQLVKLVRERFILVAERDGYIVVILESCYGAGHHCRSSSNLHSGSSSECTTKSEERRQCSRGLAHPNDTRVVASFRVAAKMNFTHVLQVGGIGVLSSLCSHHNTRCHLADCGGRPVIAREPLSTTKRNSGGLNWLP